MSITEFQLFQDQQRSNWVRLRTLVTLRWFAAAGQGIAAVVAAQVYGLQFEYMAVALVIAVSALANVATHAMQPENKRLSEREATLWLLFDLLQLSILLYLTGGLNNPFAMLLLAPVTIAATVLHLRSTVLLGATAIVLITLLGQYNRPLLTGAALELGLPALFQFGFWLALVIGVVFLAIYARQVTTEMHAMGEALVATQLALAREQKLTDLGGVVAAAAHELGTPLATIKLVSGELLQELEEFPDLLDDVALIRSQADRCRDILHSMGRVGKDDLHLRQAPLETVVREAAEPHLGRGKIVTFELAPELGANQTQPVITRRPEIIHGLRNLIQNAVDFAETEVCIEMTWSDGDISIRISDDGSGFPQSVIGRIGDPYVRRRKHAEDGIRRPGYEGMGLGLFIAKTLLERSGAELTFSNSRRHGHAGWSGQATGGAIVEVVWPRGKVATVTTGNTPPLGANVPIDPYA